MESRCDAVAVEGPRRVRRYAAEPQRQPEPATVGVTEPEPSAVGVAEPEPATVHIAQCAPVVPAARWDDVPGQVPPGR